MTVHNEEVPTPQYFLQTLKMTSKNKPLYNHFFLFLIVVGYYALYRIKYKYLCTMSPFDIIDEVHLHDSQSVFQRQTCLFPHISSICLQTPGFYSQPSRYFTTFMFLTLAHKYLK